MAGISTTTHGSDARRHKVTGDVHLLLIDADNQVLFGRRQNTGFEDGASTCRPAIWKQVSP